MIAWIAHTATLQLYKPDYAGDELRVMIAWIAHTATLQLYKPDYAGDELMTSIAEFHLGLQKLQRWRAYSERAATGTALSAALTLGAGEALTETQRKHFLSVRAFQEWCRSLAESRESALFRGKIDMRKALLQRVATIWAQDEASMLLRSSFDLWHSTQIFLARIKKLGAARRQLVEGLLSTQGEKTSGLFMKLFEVVQAADLRADAITYSAALTAHGALPGAKRWHCSAPAWAFGV
eukprot:s7198_g1.t1